MLQSPRALLRFLLAIVSAGAILSSVTSAALADERCEQLVRLHRQYAGVELTSEQQNLKVQLVAWYKANCRRARHAVSR
jgi:uncharacterized protein YeaC (DUF1315 family)